MEQGSAARAVKHVLSEAGQPAGTSPPEGRQRILLIHQNFPGQFRHLAQHLAARPDVEIIGLGRDSAPGLPGFPWFKYKLHRQGKAETHPYLRQMESAVLHGQAVVRALLKLKHQGFVPDVILAHPGWGETLYAKDVFPRARLIHLCEWYYTTQGADFDFDPEFPSDLDDRLRIQTWNALHLLNLENCDAAIAPTHWQKSRFPDAYQDKIQVIHEGIETEHLGPDPDATLMLPSGQCLKAGDPVITYVARNLEPYRGFHIFMRALPALLKANPHAQIVIVGGDGKSYGALPKDAPNWRTKMLRELRETHGDALDAWLPRIHFLGKVPYETYKKVLQISAVHVYLTYPFVLSWSLLEAMAMLGTGAPRSTTTQLNGHCVPIAIGRKNYLFAGSEPGGNTAAALYSLIGTATLNDSDSQAYLHYVFECSAETSITRVAELLPGNCAAKLPKVAG
jgi:glycosyltransferase involved in cell wall biosynthesis